jgi:hypothetical protein
MIENMQAHTKMSFASVVPTISGYRNITRTETNVVPEIKVGGIYNFTEQLGATVSYMYVFGNSISAVSDVRPGVNSEVATGGPQTLSTIMFGLNYRFA